MEGIVAAAALAGSLLHLSAPVATWDEGLPLGNGGIGALAWGEGKTLRFSLDRGDIWDLRRVPVVHEPGFNYKNMQKLVAAGDKKEFDRLFDGPYNSDHPTKLPGIRLELDLGAGRTLRDFRLDLRNGIADIGTTTGTVQAFVEADHEILRISGTGSVPEVRLRPSAGTSKLGYPPPIPGRNASEVWVDVPNSGGTYSAAARTMVSPNGWQVLATVENRPSASAIDAVRKASRWSESDALVSHNLWWKNFQDSSQVRIPDLRLQLHYDLCKYLYGAGSRKGKPPMPLQGLWTADGDGLPPWKGDYHNDLNTQTTYLAYGVAGLMDAGESWTEFNWRLLPTYREFARNFYGVEGAVVPGVMSLDGKALGGWGMYALSPTNGAWVAHQFWRHWALSGDRTFLRQRAYPFCHEIATALKALLKDEDGRLVLPLSSSPEIHDNTFKAFLKPNSNYDQALLAWLFGAMDAMARELGKDAGDWADAKAKLGSYALDPRDGSLAFAAGDHYEASHRHFSNALAIHPLGVLDSVQDASIVGPTLDRFAEKGTDWWTGYSFSWFACMLARAGRGDEALRYLADYERAFTLRNGFHVNGDQSGSGLSKFTYRPFTLEGNFLAMEAVHEMLLASHGGIVRAFPAVPSDWSSTGFTDLRAEGGHRVSAFRDTHGTVTFEAVVGPGGRLRVLDPFQGKGHWQPEPNRSQEGILEFGLPAGARVKGRR
ncbi:MAG: glycoside hydrolase N-terminal domain-containing protein [Fimbriimonadaceae bacterium]